MSEDIEALKAELAQQLALAAEVLESASNYDAQEAAIIAEEKAAYAAYQAQVAEMRLMRSSISDSAAEVRARAREAKYAQQRLEEKIAKAEAERLKAEMLEQQQLEFATLEKRWDLLTAGAPWREWAKEHQLIGAKRIVKDKRIIIADGMGLGKTLEVLIAMDMVQAATKDASKESPFGGEVKEVYSYETHSHTPTIVGGVEAPSGRRILYLCPAPLVRNTMREIQYWTKQRSPVVLGGMTKAERHFALSMLPAMPEYVIVCNYEAWRKDFALVEALKELPIDMVVLDEAHVLKDTKSLSYRKVKEILNALDPDFVIPMTGTPILNKPEDFFSLLSLVRPDTFYNKNRFLNDYCVQDSYSKKWGFRPGGMESLVKKIPNNYLRRTKEDAGIKLPPKTIVPHNITPDVEKYPNQDKARKQMRQYGSVTLNPDNPANLDEMGLPKGISAAAVIAIFTRLRQIETWPAGISIKDPMTGEVTMQLDVEESQKMDYVIGYDAESKEWDGLIPEIAYDERVVVFSQFKAPLHEMKRRAIAAGFTACVLDGDTPPDMREEIGRDFDLKHTKREDSKYQIVFANYKVGGVGMNMTGATQMIVLDEEWNPGKRDQAYDRIHRMDSDKPVTIHVLRNENTIDDWLAQIIESKEKMIDGFNEATKSMGELWDDFNDESGLL